MIKGEPMPDQADPKYQKKAEEARQAGKRFAEIIRLDKLACKIQEYANKNRTMFLVIFLSLIGIMLFISLARTVSVITSHGGEPSAIEAQHKLLDRQRGKRHIHSSQNIEEQYYPEYRNFEKK